MPQILIVEDNRFISENLAELLELEDFSVLTANNGQEAIAFAITHLPNLILSDVLMPLMDGFSMIKEIRKHQALENIPVIFITAMSEKAEIRTGLELGAVDFIVKPFEPEELIDKINKVLDTSLTGQN